MSHVPAKVHTLTSVNTDLLQGFSAHRGEVLAEVDRVLRELYSNPGIPPEALPGLRMAVSAVRRMHDSGLKPTARQEWERCAMCLQPYVPSGFSGKVCRHLDNCSWKDGR